MKKRLAISLLAASATASAAPGSTPAGNAWVGAVRLYKSRLRQPALTPIASRPPSGISATETFSPNLC
jgi:hypothetical protein